MRRASILLAVAWLFSTGALEGRECGPRSAADVRWAHAIFMGEIVKVEVAGGEASELEVTFAVSRTWRGVIGERTRVRGPMDEILLLYFGEEFVIPVSRDSEGHLRSDWCTGIEPLRHAEETLERLGEGRPPFSRRWRSSGDAYQVKPAKPWSIAQAYTLTSLLLLAVLTGWLVGSAGRGFRE